MPPDFARSARSLWHAFGRLPAPDYVRARTVAFATLAAGLLASLVLTMEQRVVLADAVYTATCIAAGAIVFIGAGETHRRAPGRVNLIVASETIIGIGIFSLVFSIGMGLMQFIAGAPQFERDKDLLAAIAPNLLSFAAGLVLAAVAPLAAIWLRNLDADAGAAGLAAGPAAAADETAALVDELERLKSRVRVASDSLEGLNEVLKRLGKEWFAAGRKVDAALDGLAHAIAGKTEAVAEEVERLREAIADVSDKIGTSADELASGADRLAATSARADESMRDLAHHTGDFKESLRDGTRLLDGLRELIAAVERFIKPDDRR